MLAQHGKEQTLATAHARQETIHRSLARKRPCYVPLRFDGHVHEVGAQLLGYPCHVLLVLMRVERAGRVDEQTTRSQTVPHVADYLALQSPAVLHVLQTPLLACALVLAEHSLARAGHVGENGVELYVRLAVVARVVVGYDHVLVTELLQVLAQNLRTCAHRFVREKQRPFGQCRTQCRRLAAGRRAEVEHAHRLVYEMAHHMVDEHRRRLLHVVRTGVQQRVEREVRSTLQVASCRRTPRHAAVLQLVSHVAPVLFERIEPHACRRVVVVERRREPIVQIVAEERTYLLFEVLW